MPHNKNDNQDAVLKTAIVTLLIGVILVFLYNSLIGRAGGFSNLYYGQSPDISNLFMPILVIAVKLLWLIFIVSLIIGLTLVVKKYLMEKKKLNLGRNVAPLEGGYSCPCCGTRLTAEFKFCPNCKASLKEICKKCGKELQVGWMWCPVCGGEKSEK